MPKHDWKCFFPYADVRPQQKDAICAAIDAFENGKKFFLLEAGTGVGKSAIGLTIARYVSAHLTKNPEYVAGAYMLTTQKILQEQYTKDFGLPGGALRSIKSSSNYPCKFYKGQSCGESLRLLKGAQRGSAFWNSCIGNCTYKKAKQSFLDAPQGVTNFSYFLAETQYAGKLEPRHLMIVDEAHNASDELSKFIEVNVTEYFCKKFLGIKLIDKTTPLKTVKWVKETYMPKLESKIKHFEQNLARFTNLREKIDSGEFANLARKFELLDKHACKMRRFIGIWNDTNWIMDEQYSTERHARKIQFKPIDVAPYANDMLHHYGQFNLLMSATILNDRAFCELLGIKSDECGYLNIPSPFPIQNRPVVYTPIGKMSTRFIDESLPKLVQAIKLILEAHPEEKGIIHTNSYKIANYIVRNIRSSRLLTHDSNNRDKVLNQHMNSDKATVLISPSMTEGVDLRDDLSRFQILCKVPYPYLGDKLIRKKMNRWKWWYDLQTAKTVIQAMGRSVRSTEDTAISYILDEDWTRFHSKNSHLFGPEYK